MSHASEMLDGEFVDTSRSADGAVGGVTSGAVVATIDAVPDEFPAASCAITVYVCVQFGTRNPIVLVRLVASW